MQDKVWEFVENGARANLYSPTLMPRASGFLWNRQMMIQMNCRGFAVAQFMQPEPAKYAYAPNLEAKTFMQPEQPYYAHHPGRFFYIKDEDTGELFSAPYEPVRKPLESFCFSTGTHDVRWEIQHQNLIIELKLSLSREDVVELWTFSIRNECDTPRNIGIYPLFTVGYMSWMNQSAAYDTHLGGIVARGITPYQKVEDYFKHLHFKELTFLLHDTQPDGFECNRERFEGEGGLHNPSGVQQPKLENGNALYETPVAALQYRKTLSPNETQTLRFLFGPAHDDTEIQAKRDHYFGKNQFDKAATNYQRYVAQGQGSIKSQTPDVHFDTVVNQWLPRQIFYHGDVNRLTTDPQTRNYLQDNMGMAYIDPKVTRAAFLHALSQQEPSGAMPDGIKLSDDAELKYINQIPHTDHGVWLPVCLQAYLDETGDNSILNELVTSPDGRVLTVSERISAAMHWLLQARDERGLSLIAQGDWCDPMNMVGYKGQGVSGWLSVATAYALQLWSAVCESQGADVAAQSFRDGASAINKAVNKHLWDGAWFARGITDNGTPFGISKDKEGRIFLNPQSWALLAQTASKEQREHMLEQIETQLETPYGVAMLAPAYTKMRDDVGRVTQKFPGSAENGSVYNHAAIFYIFSLYQIGEGERAYKLLRSMIPGPDDADILQRGQLPIFVPNYYRGAYHQHPRTAGRSSQLFNTGTVSWLYRCVLEGLFGLKGCAQGLQIQPQLPKAWKQASAERRFRQAFFKVHYERRNQEENLIVEVNGAGLKTPVIENIQANHSYDVKVWIKG